MNKDQDLIILFDVIENYIFSVPFKEPKINYRCSDILNWLDTNYPKEFKKNLYRLDVILQFILINLYIYKN